MTLKSEFFAIFRVYLLSLNQWSISFIFDKFLSNSVDMMKILPSLGMFISLPWLGGGYPRGPPLPPPDRTAEGGRPPPLLKKIKNVKYWQWLGWWSPFQSRRAFKIRTGLHIFDCLIFHYFCSWVFLLSLQRIVIP